MLRDDRLATIAPSVDIEMTGGEVILRGTVDDEKQRDALVQSAQQVAGSTKVINLLELAHSHTANAARTP